MYEGYFGLTERPFSIAPDPQYLYMSTRHKEAMAHLSYGLSQGGCFIVLTGEVGTGKTTLCRNLLGDLPENVDVALILNANINETELLQTVCDELKIDYQESSSQKQLLDRINNHLLNTFADNRHTILIIDEAQLLSRDVLEQIRLLTNLETTKSKLLQIILIGQPELNDLLSRNDLRQLAQRVTARFHLGTLERNEIEGYVNYRLGVAGCKQPLFSRQALNKMYSLTSGIPRKINVLADHALLATYAQTQSVVDAKTVNKAAKDVFIQADKASRPKASWNPRWGYIVAVFLALNLALWAYSHYSQETLVSEAVIDVEPAVVSVDDSAVVLSDQAPAAQASSQIAEPEAVLAEQTLDAGSIVVTNNQALPTPGRVVISEDPLDASAVMQPNSVSQGLVQGDSTPPLNRRLETSADLTGRIATFRRLAGQWGVQMPDKLLQPACTVLGKKGLQCLGVETWKQVLSYNRPTIMVIKHQDQLHRVILQKVEGDIATIQIGDDIESISVAELNQAWTKNAITFWLPGDAGSAFLQLDDRSNQLPILRAMVNQALAENALPLLDNVDSTYFDLDLSQKVFALQSRFGIDADSRIGNQTYLLLNEILNPDSTLTLTNRAP